MNKIFNTLVVLIFSINLAAMEKYPYKGLPDDEEGCEKPKIKRKNRSKSANFNNVFKNHENKDKNSSGKNSPGKKRSPFWSRGKSDENNNHQELKKEKKQKKLNERLASSVSDLWLKEINELIQSGADLGSHQVKGAIKVISEVRLNYPGLNDALMNNASWEIWYDSDARRDLEKNKDFINQTRNERINNMYRTHGLVI